MLIEVFDAAICIATGQPISSCDATVRACEPGMTQSDTRLVVFYDKTTPLNVTKRGFIRNPDQGVTNQGRGWSLYQPHGHCHE